MRDNPLDAIARYCDRELKEQFGQCLYAHTGAALEAAGVSPTGFAERLGEEAYLILYACVLEDIMTRPEAALGANVTDAFLKRNGWKLTPSVRRAMVAVRDSVMGIYEVTASYPGVAVELRDLLVERPTIEVRHEGLSEAMSPQDVIGCRIIQIDGDTILSAGFLPMEAAKAADVVQSVRAIAADDAAGLAPHISNAWLAMMLREAVDKE